MVEASVADVAVGLGAARECARTNLLGHFSSIYDLRQARDGRLRVYRRPSLNDIARDLTGTGMYLEGYQDCKQSLLILQCLA
jgi:hypothetical protein